MGLKTIAAAGVLAACGTAAVIARADDPSGRAAQADGGLALSRLDVRDGSVMIDRPAQAGAVDHLRVINKSKSALDVTVTARPWTQSSSGAVSPNRRAKLGGVAVSESTFSLAPGAWRDFSVTLTSSPAYLYGALEIVGLPSDVSKRKGVVPGYRVVSSLRYNAAKPVYKLKPGAIKASRKAVTLKVRNSGNTIAPVTGSVRLRGPLGTKNGSLKATRILPRKTVALNLVSRSNLRPGTYTATVTLIQNKVKTKVTKRVRVAR
ncbi:MAG TPA: hypothetical protein VNS09_09685 [Solirubrobacter sp.]|nr:hypothetical protein [Solirubrobacter sp.]